MGERPHPCLRAEDDGDAPRGEVDTGYEGFAQGDHLSALRARQRYVEKVASPEIVNRHDFADHRAIGCDGVEADEIGMVERPSSAAGRALRSM